MSDSISAVGAVAETAAPSQQYDLDQLSRHSQIEEVQGANFSNMVEGALSKALEGPHGHDPLDNVRSDLSGPSTGAVGQEKNAVVSDVERPGAESKNQDDASTEILDAVTHRANTLYTEMTIYNVAWGVAMRTQKDISQLLRGS